MNLDVLNNASCRECADVTKAFEQTVQRGLLLPLRLIANTRTRKKTRPKGFPAIITNGKNTDDVVLSAEEMPFAALAYKFIVPRHYLGLPPDFISRPFFDVVVVRNPYESRNSKWDGNPEGMYQKARVRVMFHPAEFCRMLAKIAYCLTISKHGLCSVKSYLPDVILGRFPDYNYYVGHPCEAQSTMDALWSSGNGKNTLHRTLLIYDKTTGKTCIRCLISLFSPVGFPVYEVMVGELQN